MATILFFQRLLQQVAAGVRRQIIQARKMALVEVQEEVVHLQVQQLELAVLEPLDKATLAEDVPLIYQLIVRAVGVEVLEVLALAHQI
jgi:hypothetical protein